MKNAAFKYNCIHKVLNGLNEIRKYVEDIVRKPIIVKSKVIHV